MGSSAPKPPLRAAHHGGSAPKAAFAAALALALAAVPAAAQDATQQARVLFNAGAQAYEAGQFTVALQAFAEAYRLSPRPGILFSMAQAHRKQYILDKQPLHAREAVRLYREYVAKVEQGGRRGDAVQALAELEPIVEKLGADTAASSPEVKPKTRLMVTAQTKDALISLDGTKPVDAPLYAEVTPGPHKVRITAAGYSPEERDVRAAEGGIVALDVPMRELPGMLTVVARDGADVSVDGRLAATTPLPRPIELASGPHFVTVTKRGYHAFSEDLTIGRGEAKTLDVSLDVTGQRISVYVLTGVAVAGAVAGGVLAGLAVYEQGQAQSLDNRRMTKGGLSSADLTQLDNDISLRDTLRTPAGIALGGAAAIGATALVLALTDQPAIGPAAHRDNAPKPTAPAKERPMEMSAAPILGPGLYGVALTGRF